VALGETDGAVPHRDRGSPTGVHWYPPRPRSLRTERRSLPARVPPMDSVDDPLRPCRLDRQLRSQGGQFFVSPEGHFRMSFDSKGAAVNSLGMEALRRSKCAFSGWHWREGWF